MSEAMEDIECASLYRGTSWPAKALFRDCSRSHVTAILSDAWHAHMFTSEQLNIQASHRPTSSDLSRFTLPHHRSENS